MITPGSLSGVWQSSSKRYPGESNYMWIDESRGRMVDFIFEQLNERRRLPMRAWYQVISDTEIVTRFPFDGEGTKNEVSFRDGNLVLKNVRGEFEFRRLPESEFPEWLGEMVAASNAKMDEKEKKN